MAVPFGFDAALYPGQLPIGEQFRPAPQVQCGLHLVLRQFDGQCRHGAKLASRSPVGQVHQTDPDNTMPVRLHALATAG